MRYLRAFYKTIQLMIQGKEPDSPVYRLRVWMNEGQQLVENAYQAAEQAGLDANARKAFKLSINRRAMSMETILAAVRHNITTEYPMLLQSKVEGNIVGIYSLNMDDQFRVSQLAASEELPASVRVAVTALAEHLNNPPPSV